VFFVVRRDLWRPASKIKGASKYKPRLIHITSAYEYEQLQRIKDDCGGRKYYWEGSQVFATKAQRREDFLLSALFVSLWQRFLCIKNPASLQDLSFFLS
jgi:hypothetical protein